MKFDRNSFLKRLGSAKENEEKVTKGGVSNNFFKTEKFWSPEIPKKGKNTFRIRILTDPTCEHVPWQLVLNHTGIKTTNGWLNEFCPETFPENKNQCPLCNKARELYATGDPIDAKKGSEYWRKKSWVTNILVVKDSRNDGENEGKVFMWKFGKKMYDKFDAALFPNEDAGEEGVFFIDPNKGYDFNLLPINSSRLALGIFGFWFAGGMAFVMICYEYHQLKKLLTEIKSKFVQGG